MARLNALLLFFSPNRSDDVHRLVRYASRQRETIALTRPATDSAWQKAYLRLETLCLDALLPTSSDSATLDALLDTLAFVVSSIPQESATLSLKYYTTLASLPIDSPSHVFDHALFAPLASFLLASYEGLVAAYLTRPHHLEALRCLSANIDLRVFTQAASNVSTHLTLDSRCRLWLLAQYIYIIHDVHDKSVAGRNTPSLDIVPHIPTIARLLASLADDIAPEAALLDMNNLTYDRDVLATREGARVPLNKFLHDQIQRLVDQKGIRSLLARPNTDTTVAALDTDSDTTQLLAGYALTLLRIFPLRADDIRMWLYLGPSGQARATSSIPAIAYFWRGARKTSVFDAIFRDPRAAVNLLTPAKPSTSAWQPPNLQREQSEKVASEWRVLIVFLELYTFVLKIMDDEEFLGGESISINRMTNNALPLSDIKDLSIFLKNLGFAMYYHAQDIADSFQPSSQTLTPASLARHFGGSSTSAEPEPEAKPLPQSSVAGIMGMSLDYLKGLVTGLLRAVYERDSRRHFLPKGHWLMTSPFDMSNFIQAVVGEEERRKQLQSQEEDDDDDDSDAELENWSVSHTSRTQNRHLRLQRDQRRASRKRYLQVVAPRLEILQNMPFLIPFETRVEVFREFVRLDQVSLVFNTDAMSCG